jgi:hypothetical protein
MTDEGILAPSRPLGRLIAALPDALTCIAYAWTWLQPLRFDSGAVKTLMLVMLMEFLCVHSGGFLGVTVLSDGFTRLQKSFAILGLGCFYLMFATAFSLAFHAWWPVWTFVWLLGSRFALVWLSPVPRENEVGRQMSLWALSVAAYLAGVFLGVLLPIPELGITAQVMPALGLEGGGLWVEQPQTVIASGTFYFAVMAWSKWKWGAPI